MKLNRLSFSKNLSNSYFKFMIKKTFILIFFSISILNFAQQTTGKFKEKVETEFELNYLLRLPESQPGKYPLMIFLHGAGERGTDINKVILNGPLQDKYKEYTKEFAILAPQCPENQYWDVEAVYHLIQKIIKDNPKIDTHRIYLTGLSMGGWGSWRLAEKHPELFAGLITVCAPSGLAEKREAHFIKHIPTRIFHGALDDVVPVGNSIEMYKELKSMGADVDLTIFKDDNHNSWDSTYSNPELYKWILKQRKN